MNTPCKIVLDLLPLYCDQVCSAESSQLIRQHLNECEKCCESYRLMQEDSVSGPEHIREQQLAAAASAAWKKGKRAAWIKGCLIGLLCVLVLAGTFVAVHWFSSAAGDDDRAMTMQAAEYLNFSCMDAVQTAQRGDYRAVLYTDGQGKWSMCLFERDSLFQNRWRAAGGKSQLTPGKLNSWNGGLKADAVLIFCGGDLPDEICWYQFENSAIQYTCPVQNNTVLDLFIIPDSYDINGSPVPLDANRQELNEYRG